MSPRMSLLNTRPRGAAGAPAGAVDRHHGHDVAVLQLRRAVVTRSSWRGPRGATTVAIHSGGSTSRSGSSSGQQGFGSSVKSELTSHWNRAPSFSWRCISESFGSIGMDPSRLRRIDEMVGGVNTDSQLKRLTQAAAGARWACTVIMTV